MEQAKIRKLKKYFQEENNVLMAFVFGSYAKGKAMRESDFDIAVYLNPKLEQKEKEKTEDRIWSKVSRIIEKEVDLVCLNQAPATLVSSVLKSGILLVIKDRKLYWKLYLEKSLEAEDFLQFARDFFQIARAAKSLNPEEETKLLERIQFLKNELQEIENFKKITFEEYEKNRDKKRNIERWVENIINATIDIAKIISASEKKKMPRSYEEALRDFGTLVGLTREEVEKFSRFANLRNILAHEYLDILYNKIQDFIKESPGLYKKILNFLERYLK